MRSSILSLLCQLTLALVSLCCLAPSAWSQAANKGLRIVNAKAYLGEGKYLEHATIDIVGDKITAVKAQPPGKAAGKFEGQVIDAQGMTVTPGLVAAQSPMGLVEIEAEARTRDHALEVEHPVRAAYQPARAVFADSSLLTMAMRWGVTSAAVTPQGGLVSGQVAWMDLLPGQHEELVANPSVAMAANLGQSVQGSRAASLQALANLLDDAKFYRAQKGAFDRGAVRPLAAPAQDLAALADVTRGRQPLLVQASRASDILAALDLAKRYNLDLAIVGAQEGWKVADRLAKAGVWVLVRPTDNLPRGFSTLGARLDNATLMHKAGVKLVIANIGSAHNAAQLRFEAGNAVAYGLEHHVALDAITSAPAKLYKMDRSYGKIARGYVANLVIWSGDPLEFSSKAQEVICRGQRNTQPSRQDLLVKRYLDLGRFAPAKLPSKFHPQAR